MPVLSGLQLNYSVKQAHLDAEALATGLTEDMLSHVLAGRKHLAIETLSEALQKIGFSLRIVPVKTIEPVSQP